MGRLFAFALCLLLLPAPCGGRGETVRPVLFSAIFPGLVPQGQAQQEDMLWPPDALLERLFGEGEQV